MLAILAAVAWIVLDVIMTLITSPPIPPWQWNFIVYGGGLVVLFTIAAGLYNFFQERKEKKNSAVQMTGLREQLIKQEGMIMGMGISVNRTHERLVKETETKPDPSEALRSAISELSESQKQLSGYEAILWRPPTYEERKDIVERLMQIGRHSVYIAHTGQQDCYEFAAELAGMFQEARWSVWPIRPEADPKAHGTRSIEFVGKDENRLLIRSVSDALLGLTKQSGCMTSALYAGATDVMIKIGPRKMRGSEYL
jgi:hypothetical protein